MNVSGGNEISPANGKDHGAADSKSVIDLVPIDSKGDDIEVKKLQNEVLSLRNLVQRHEDEISAIKKMLQANGTVVTPSNDGVLQIGSGEPINEVSKENEITAPEKVGDSSDDSDEEELEKLGEDVYSLLFISDYFSLAFFYSALVSGIQFSVILLIITDLMKNGNLLNIFNDENPFNLPVLTSWEVTCAQFISIVLAFFSVSDVIDSTKMMIRNGYDRDIKTDNPGASLGKFALANSLRFLEGLLALIMRFLFIVQANSILTIFSKFAAAGFINKIDDMFFKYANTGLIGSRLKAATEKVSETKMVVKRKNYDWLFHLSLVILFLPFLVGMIFVATRENNGFLLARTSCFSLDVKFGLEDVYEFGENVSFSFHGEGATRKFHGSEREVASSYFENPHPLLYRYFSHRYIVGGTGSLFGDFILEHYNERPVYWERGIRESTSGKFYYCANERSWVFTIEALYKEVGDKGIRDECEWGWLLRSPSTDAATLEDAPQTGWDVWSSETTVGSTSLSIECLGCKRDADCGMVRGKCIRDQSSFGTCDCADGFEGAFCESGRPCDEIGWISYGASAFDYGRDGPYVFSEDRYPRVYGQPVYALDRDDINYTEIILYTGRSWSDTFWKKEDLAGVDFDNFHSYWDNIFEQQTVFYSAPTDDDVHSGLQWFEKQNNGHAGIDVHGIFGQGIFGFNTHAGGNFRCLNINCHGKETCGDHGLCVDNANRIDDDDALLGNSVCDCHDYFGGFYCEYAPDSQYASGMYELYQTNRSQIENEPWYLENWAKY